MRAFIVVNDDLCKGCEICVATCPTDTLSIAKEPNKKGYYPAIQHAPDQCTGCRQCALMCPEVAIKVIVEK
ncbi:4Fe-4S binding protein [Tepidibacillus infernus]|uniref:Tungsten formylmethanofuran dehydrogenase n=1 Tax=Tepidibacillus decaturensis TaxID=1413211 RepID=A0A135L0S9_9BACI|nr:MULTISPECIES: 4Fe-4S binding protein [Tepidibacillus]KXG42601.1 tungsten formylmethanofuran dehydrogenase [Tepidibacillus decaturensis]GBF12588.1 2-oxoglutarate-acceptor oxidoreductase subunit OorD [Tepidibacillus sp. HK-1]